MTGEAADIRIPHHRRSIVFDVYDADNNAVEIVGRLRDERPWASNPLELPVIHDLELDVTVSLTDFTVQGVDVRFHTYPHAECPEIAEAFQQLVGLPVGRGWVNAMRERVGGPAGCTHLRELARGMAPVLLQAAFSAAVRNGYVSTSDASSARALLPMLTGSCHIWAGGGIAEQKIDHGWRPGTTEYPVPPLASFLDGGTDS
ncbi:MAG: DUF2889 domain-containing protein [Actinomycetes bacterium]